MPVDLHLPLGTLVSFAFVLARVGGAVSFVPLPGLANAPAAGRAVLALAITLALFPAWPAAPAGAVDAGAFVRWIVSEAAFGVTVGLAVAFLNEAFVLASQIFGLQAGYGYASMVDPGTQADASVLQVFSHLVSGLLFFTFGLHREVVRVFALSLSAHPPGSYEIGPRTIEQILGLGALMFTVALRLALPVVGLLTLVDLSLALLGRINAQLQLLMLAFPLKMLASMVLLAALVPALPRLYAIGAAEALAALRALAGGGG
jgi:flagellar biosynthetic protein FliR